MPDETRPIDDQLTHLITGTTDSRCVLVASTFLPGITTGDVRLGIQQRDLNVPDAPNERRFVVGDVDLAEATKVMRTHEVHRCLTHSFEINVGPEPMVQSLCVMDELDSLTWENSTDRSATCNRTALICLRAPKPRRDTESS